MKKEYFFKCFILSIKKGGDNSIYLSKIELFRVFAIVEVYFFYSKCNCQSTLEMNVISNSFI